MKTLLHAASLQFFFALCAGLTLVACQSETIVPNAQSRDIHIARPRNQSDTLSIDLPSVNTPNDSVKTEPQPRTKVITF